MRKLTASILIISISILISGCLKTSNVILEKIESPNHKYVAYKYRRDGGMTTGYSYHLSLQKRWIPLTNQPGNVFISDENFNVRWTESNVLSVQRSANQMAFKQEIKISNITITYSFYKGETGIN